MPGKKSAHSLAMRQTLRAAREARKWTAQHVADLIVEELNRRAEDGFGEPIEKMTGQNVSNYELNKGQPPIDKFAAWAHVLGYKLIVDLEEQQLGRRPVMLATDEARDAALEIDLMDEPTRRAFRRFTTDEVARELLVKLMSLPASRRRALLEFIGKDWASEDDT